LKLPIIKQIPLDSISFGERFRQNYGDLEELGQSILDNGLINPITVGLNPTPDQAPYLLAAGGRRTSAFKLLAQEREEFNFITACVYEKVLSTLELRSIELEENIKRLDLDYAEEIRLKEEVHALRTAISGPKVSRDDSEGWSQRETAKLFGKSPSSIAEDLQLARAFKDLPELGLDRMKNKSEAKKMLKSLGSTLTTQAKAATYQDELAKEKSIKSKISNSYITGDFFEGVLQIPNETIDFLEIDPPYGVELQTQKKGYTPDGYNEVDKDKYLPFLEQTLKEAYRVMKQDSWLVLWFGPEPWAETCYNLLIKAGFRTSRKVCVWFKGEEKEDINDFSTSGQTNQPMSVLANGYEFFYYAAKGKPQLNRPGRTNVFPFKPVPHQRKIHPTERPLELIEDVLTTFVPPGSRILVPFLGSGKTLLAAFNCNMHAMGWELNDIYKDRFIIQVIENLDFEPSDETKKE